MALPYISLFIPGATPEGVHTNKIRPVPSKTEGAGLSLYIQLFRTGAHKQASPRRAVRSAQEQAAGFVGVDGQGVAGGVAARDDLFGDHRFHMRLDIPLERACGNQDMIMLEPELRMMI